MIIGITGSIGSGKSTVSKYIEEKGYKIIDADKIAYSVFDENIKSIKKLFPKAFIGDKIDRKQISLEIFTTPLLKEKLEKIIHPKVLSIIKKEIKKNKKKILFLDVPLLYEANYQKICDKVIVVYVDLEKQVERLMKRDKIDKEYALKKIDSQISMEEKKKRADYVVDNSFSVEETYAQLEEILEKIK